MDSMAEGGFESDTIPIMCGSVAGQLHTQLFKCPGIRVPCVEFQSSFITPKDFTFVGNKHTLKDWKTAIKCRGISIRKMMDSGALDFYNHDDLCTGRCMSRAMNHRSTPNFFSSPLTTMTHDASTMDSASGTSLDEQTYTVLREMQDADSNIAEINIASVESLVENGRDEKPSLESMVIKTEPQDSEDEDPPQQQQQAAAKTTTAKPMQFVSQTNGLKTVIFTPSSAAGKFGKSKYNLSARQVEEDFRNLAESFPNVDDFLHDSKQFWQSILKLGLMESIMKEIKLALEQQRTAWAFKDDITEDEAKRMSLAISNLGLTQILKNKLANHKTAMSRQNIKLQMEIEDLKKKLAESERKKDENDKKSEAFESLIEMESKAKSMREKPETTKNYQLIYTKIPTVVEASGHCAERDEEEEEDEESPQPKKRQRKSTPKKDQNYHPDSDTDCGSD